ncbi:class I SAM-dependent methyltransferase [Oceanithermus sp.]
MTHDFENDAGETREVQSFYDANAEVEWARLERHRTEFAVKLRALEGHLPPPPAAVLDVGGGPGRYAIELARRGYRVTLVDLSAANLELARRRADEAGVRLEGAVRAAPSTSAAFPTPLATLFSSWAPSTTSRTRTPAGGRSVRPRASCARAA